MNYTDTQMLPTIEVQELEPEEIVIHDVEWYTSDDRETNAALNLSDTMFFINLHRGDL